MLLLSECFFLDLGLGNQYIKNGLSIYAFRSTGSLRNHYLDQHDQNLEIRRSGDNKRQPQDDLVRKSEMGRHRS